MVIEISVPTKVTLFGEHAVVYGVPAIASTIPIYLKIIGEKLNDNVIQIEMKQGIHVPLHSIIIKRKEGNLETLSNQNYVKRILSYILTALDVCEETLGLNTDRFGYNIVIDSPLPVGVGLGTSAAISVGIITMCMSLNDYLHDLESQRLEIAKMAWNVEKKVQGSASPMDTYTITLGGLRYIDPSIPAASPIDLDYKLPLIVGYTKRTGTTAELIKKVQLVRERVRTIFNDALNLIKHIVEEAKKALLSRDLETLGILMNINHSILKALGVVNLEHDFLAHILRNAGALGVKTSGAGNGGAFIVLASSDDLLEKLVVVAESLGANIISKGITNNGVNIYRRR